MSKWLAEQASGLMGKRPTRRSFLQKTTLAATALSVAPVDYILRPISAYSAICSCAGSSCDCGAFCCDGYTEFCCTINNGINACPAGTFAGGWWKADGSVYCAGPRYYIDCMAECVYCTAGCGTSPFCDAACDDVTCECAYGNCNNRHIGCAFFRYGQCHQEIGCSGRISCRVASCTPPWLIDATCTTASATDDTTANHNVPCLEQPPPPPPIWHPWTSSPGPSVGVAGGPAVAAWGPGRLDVLVLGKNGQVWHEWSTDGGQSFSGWEDLGGPAVGLLGSPAAVSWGPGRLDIFARGQDNGLWHLWFDTKAWGVWERIGGPITSSPAVASWGPGRLDIFGNLPDRSVGHWWFDQTAWFGVEPLGGLSFEDPAAVSWGPGRIDLFIVSTGSAIVHKWWGGTQWLGWVSDFAGAWATTPTVASWGPGRLDLFAGYPYIYAFVQVGHEWFDQTAWFGLDDRGCCLVAAPAAVSWGIDRIDVFGLESNGNLAHFFFGS